MAGKVIPIEWAKSYGTGTGSEGEAASPRRYRACPDIPEVLPDLDHFRKEVDKAIRDGTYNTHIPRKDRFIKAGGVRLEGFEIHYTDGTIREFLVGVDSQSPPPKRGPPFDDDCFD